MASIYELIAEGGRLPEITRKVFNELDTNQSGQIEWDELSEALNRIYAECGLNPPTAEDVERKMKELDTDKSGTISAEELEKYVRELLGDY
ncbi:unnamed protein product [Blepharisma stoltei]|uniref:EF-hand domain-containing protein n=1 Tax=Blepharisma stoltei TaxID=1481888 RepID=A0AAU9J6T5_9CILI|nr:unnamed protein product [Blepharisma stoltei]